MEYLKYAIRLESNSLGEQTIIDDYVSASEKKKPQLITEPEPMLPMMKQVPVLDSDDKGWIAFSILCYVVAAICLIGFLSSLAGGPLYEDGSSKASVWRIQIIAGLISLGIGGFITFVIHGRRKEIKSAEEYNVTSQSNYRNKCRENEEKNRQHAKEYNENMQTWRINVDNNLEYLHEKRGETLKVLSDYYKPNIIFPKYHSLPALTTIYEYLSSGRCDTLTGPNGAYNLYESELRQNTIIEKLNTIIADLEQIKKNQFALYQELTRINATTRQISYEMSAIRGYTQKLTALTALNTYYAAVTADNTAALTFLTILG